MFSTKSNSSCLTKKFPWSRARRHRHKYTDPWSSHREYTGNQYVKNVPAHTKPVHREMNTTWRLFQDTQGPHTNRHGYSNGSHTGNPRRTFIGSILRRIWNCSTVHHITKTRMMNFVDCNAGRLSPWKFRRVRRETSCMLDGNVTFISISSAS